MDKEIFVHDSKGNIKAVATLSLKTPRDTSPIYGIKNLCVIEENKENKGYGTKLIQKVSSFLDENKAEGSLVNLIDEKNPAQKKLYKNDGWEQIKNTKYWRRPIQ